jgi:hypothetical protein
MEDISIDSFLIVSCVTFDFQDIQSNLEKFVACKYKYKTSRFAKIKNLHFFAVKLLVWYIFLILLNSNQVLG